MPPPPITIEHLENFQPDDIARLGADVIASVQPHLTLDRWPGAFGPQRVPYMSPAPFWIPAPRWPVTAAPRYRHPTPSTLSTPLSLDATPTASRLEAGCPGAHHLWRALRAYTAGSAAA